MQFPHALVFAFQLKGISFMMLERCLSVIIKFYSNLARQSKSSWKDWILSLNEL